MSTLDWLSDDFQAVALPDCGVDVTIAHITGQTLSPTTGAYTNTLDTDTVEGVMGEISKKDIAIAPHDLHLGDVVIRVSEDDLSFIPARGDTVSIGSSVYMIIATLEIDDVIKLFLRKT